jgi:hypothetical protein
LVASATSTLSGPHQLAFVLVAITGDVSGDLVHDHPALGPAQRVHHDGDGGPGAIDDLQLHLGDRALHLQQRRPVRLMEDAAADGEQILKSALADQLFGGIAEPLAEEAVDPAEGTIGARLQQAAGGGVQNLEYRRRERRIVGRFRQRPSLAKNSSMAMEHAAGALRCGQ